MAVFVNFTNHDSSVWGEAQMREALRYGSVVDVRFPNVDPLWGESQVLSAATEYADRIMMLQPAAVLCQGEYSLCFQVVTLLLKRGVKVLCACSERSVDERVLKNGRTEKNIVFNFVRFREYIQEV